MYHKATPCSKAYYDTLEEMPNMAKVRFPNEKEPVEMTVEQMYELSREGWRTIMNTCNYGVCDHWDSVPLSVWVDKRFKQILHYTSNGKADGKHIGYNRASWYVILTRDKHYHKSEVWNS